MQFRDVIPPFSLRMVRKRIDPHRHVVILDVGPGTFAPMATARVFPNATYHAIDVVDPPAELRALMQAFFRMDIEKADFSPLSDGLYDAIIMSHVIEHVSNGAQVICGLAPKLRPGGIFFVEFPAARSLGFPSGAGVLQFCDDETHVRVYDVKEVANAMLASGIKVVDAGIRRDRWRLLFAPLSIPLQVMTLLKEGRPNARGLWDVLGFSDYVIGIKRSEAPRDHGRIGADGA
jgi:2-polyprenyl-3-methyl-5-hydroxy-6-metoxy-1,4-benzoquinol methylase